MMNRAPLVLLLVAAGIAAFWLFSGEEPDLRPEGSGATTEAAATDADEGAGQTAAAAGVEVEVADEVAADFLRAAVGVDEGPSGRALIVQVWLGKEGVPAPDAEVFVLEGSDEAKAQSEDPFAPHISELGETRGKRFSADAEGRVELPPVEDWVILTARSPGTFGEHVVGSDHADVEAITLRPDEAVTVRVVDAAGEPVADAPVGVLQLVPFLAGREKAIARMDVLMKDMTELWERMQASPAQRERGEPHLREMKSEYGRLQREVGGGKKGGKKGGKRGGRGGKAAAAAKAARRKPREYDVRPELRASRRTDEHGLAVFRHFQLYRNQGDESWPEQHHDRFEAVLLTPLSRPESRAFAGRPVPEDILELRLPDTGSIALRTVDRDGRPFTHPVSAELRLAAEDAATWSRVQVRKEQNERAIVFPFVGLDLSFGASCRLDDDDFRWQAPPFAGPKSPGERVELDLVIAPEAGMLFGRLFDATGEPLGGEEITFLINGLAGRLEGEEVLLDDAGRFHLPYRLQPQHQPPFRLQIRRPGVVPVAGRSLPLESLPPAHVTDIGELAIDSLGVVARGVVTNDVGEPIPGVHVKLQRERFVDAKTATKEFREEAFCAAHTDEEGRFALFGELERGRYRLRADVEDHFHTETPDLRRDGGSTDIEMQRKARVLGTVIVPEWMHFGWVHAFLQPVHVPQARPGEAETRDERIQEHDGKTYAHFDWVRPGTYDVVFRLNGFPEPFLRIEDLVMQPGQQDIHPRLRDLDLGSYIFRFEIHPTDENGEPVVIDRPLLTKVTRSSGEPQWLCLPMRGSFGEVFSTTPMLEVFPMASGFVADRQVLAPGRCDVFFRRIPPVDVVLAGLSAMSDGVPVRVLLEQLEREGLPQQLDVFDNISKRMSTWYTKSRFFAAMLGSNDTARLEVTGGGLHKVVLRFGASKVQPTTVELGAVEIKLVPGGGPERIAVPFDAQVVQQAIADARQRIEQEGGR